LDEVLPDGDYLPAELSTAQRQRWRTFLLRMHDALIVARSHAKAGERALFDAFSALLKVRPRITIDPPVERLERLVDGSKRVAATVLPKAS